MSHENMLTMEVGTLVPVLVEPLYPNEKVSLGYFAQVQMPPMATDAYGMVDLRVEAFFVPNRILWGGWQNFMTMPQDNPFAPTVVRQTRLPSIQDGGLNPTIAYVSSQDWKYWFGPGSLLDYVGFKGAIETPGDNQGYVLDIPNMLPLLAYHRIYDEWYRNPNVTQPLFVRPESAFLGSNLNVSFLPWDVDNIYDASQMSRFQAGMVTSSPTPEYYVSSSLYFRGNNNPGSVNIGDKNIFSLHQRQWAKDYYTTASLYPQSNGSVTGAEVEVASEAFTISQLRSANVLQRWLERNNIAGQRYSDQIKATWGIMPSDALVDRPIFLGSHKFGIYNKTVTSTAKSNPSDADNNPYSGHLGNRGGQMGGLGDGSLVDSFTASEHGFLMVIASVVPHAYYSTGSRKYLRYSEIGDFPNPLLQGLGEQAIMQSELLSNYSDSANYSKVFGYQQQYSEVKYHDDEVHGLLQDGQSLQAFAIQRSFAVEAPGQTVDLSTQFLEIPKNALDGILASSSMNGGAISWCDFYFNFKKVTPFSEYVIPTLGDLKNTHKENIDYRGRYL